MFEAIKHSLLDPPDDPGAERWAPQRRAARECDGALNGTARLWLRRLPSRRRPLRLCQTFPRVANRIAWCWYDVALSEQALDDLLTDRRGGRRGFPPAVVRELQRLRDFNAHQRRDDAPDGLWTRLGRWLGG
jgi:hypothetical protein